MRRPALTTFQLAKSNLTQKGVRTVCLILLVAAIAFVIAGGTLFGFSLERGVESARDRLGADAIFVPREAETDIEGALLQGVPSTFYMNSDLLQSLAQTAGVAQASPQLFIATASASAGSHCGIRAQIIGYDPETDFVITPWLSKSLPGGPQQGEVVVGEKIGSYEIGSSILLYGKEYTVVAKLDKTGMGFDDSAFVNMETARTIFADYKALLPPKDAQALPDDPANVVSSVIVNTEEGVDLMTFIRATLQAFRGEQISVVKPQAMIGDLSNNLGLTLAILRILLTALWLLSVIVLMITFSATLNERKREFGVLRAIGATRKKLVGIVLSESVLIGGIGAAIGVGLLCLVVFPFNALIEAKLSAEYLLPAAPVIAAILAAAFAISAAMGPLASIHAAIRIGKKDAFSVIKEGE